MAKYGVVEVHGSLRWSGGLLGEAQSWLLRRLGWRGVVIPLAGRRHGGNHRRWPGSDRPKLSAKIFRALNFGEYFANGRDLFRRAV